MTSVHSVFDVRIFHKEAKTLVKEGYEVVLIAPYQKKESEVDGISIIPLPDTKNRLLRMSFGSFLVIKIAIREKACVYHFHDPELIGVGLLLRYITHAKIVYDVHEDVQSAILSKNWIPTILRKPVSFVFNLLEKRSVGCFDCVIAVTPNIKDKFGKNTVCVSNYPILAYFKSGILEKNAEKPQVKNEHRFSVIYTGGLERIRGVKEAVLSLGYVDPRLLVELNLAGEFSEERFKEELAGLSEWKNVNFFGFLPLSRVYQELLKADAGLVCFLPEPNHINSQPNKMFEYMAAGLPVIASNFIDWKRIIEGNKCGICVDPSNPREIGQAIEYLARHRKEAREMGERGKAAVINLYNWEKESEKLVNIYKNLCAE